MEKIYIDMDGVLADFDLHFVNLYGFRPHDFEQEYGQVAFWELIYETPNFFATMPPMKHMKLILDYCNNLADKCIILSSPSRTNKPLCMMQKRQWIDEHIGSTYPAIFESDKHKYAGQGRLLIDDTKSKCDKWTQSGGMAHLFTDINNFQIFMSTF